MRVSDAGIAALMNEIAQGWAERIKACWRQSADAIIETGRLLQQAKDDLGHGQWLKMLDGISFHKRKAQRLMEIAADERFSNASILTLLPDEWTSCHALHKIECDVPKLLEYLQQPQLVKAEKRASKEFLLGAKQRALPKQRHGVIVCDPPWRYEPYSRETGMDRAADNHYPTADVESIAVSHDVPSIAAPDCVLFLWATVPMLTHALWLIDHWRFTYKSQFVWIKDKFGTGYWNRNAHELLLIATQGIVPTPAPGTRERSVIQAPVTKHSAKPEIILEYIEGWYPTLPKVELNRRGPARPGWTVWGNESEQTNTERAASCPATVVPELSPVIPHPSGEGSTFSDSDIPPLLRIGDPLCWRKAMT